MEEYEINLIPLDYIDYRWSAPKYPENTKQRINARYEKWSQNLMGTDESIAALFGSNNRVKGVYLHIIEHGMKNPLTVKPHTYDDTFDGKQYYVVVGNQRLAILRALQKKNMMHIALGEEAKVNGIWMVPCRIALEGDTWEDNTEAAKLNEKITIIYG